MRARPDWTRGEGSLWDGRIGRGTGTCVVDGNLVARLDLAPGIELEGIELRVGVRAVIEPTQEVASLPGRSAPGPRRRRPKGHRSRPLGPRDPHRIRCGHPPGMRPGRSSRSRGWGTALFGPAGPGLPVATRIAIRVVPLEPSLRPVREGGWRVASPAGRPLVIGRPAVQRPVAPVPRSALARLLEGRGQGTHPGLLLGSGLSRLPRGSAGPAGPLVVALGHPGRDASGRYPEPRALPDAC